MRTQSELKQFAGEVLIAQDAVQRLTAGFRHVPGWNFDHFDLKPSIRKIDRNDVAGPDGAAWFGGLAVDGNPSLVARLLGRLPLLDDTGLFEKQIDAHRKGVCNYSEV